MSGSGATCFGLFADQAAAQTAAAQIERAHPQWWVTPAILAKAD
jgi:4-diphosphocytidyl-2-C-methyl-D-erythritol kinase